MADTLFFLPANLHRRFHSTVSRTDHEEHSFVLLGSPKERGIVFVISTFLDRGLTAFAVVQGFKDKCGDSLCTIRSHLTGDSPIDVLWIKSPFRFFQDDVRTKLRALGHLDILAFIHELSEA